MLADQASQFRPSDDICSKHHSSFTNKCPFYSCNLYHSVVSVLPLVVNSDFNCDCWRSREFISSPIVTCHVTNTKGNFKTLERIRGIRVLRNLFFPPTKCNVLISLKWLHPILCRWGCQKFRPGQLHTHRKPRNSNKWWV